MGKLATKKVPQGFQKPEDWYLMTIVTTEMMFSKTGKPMVKMSLSIDDALTEDGQNFIGRPHMQWFLVRDEPAEEGTNPHEVDWNPYSGGTMNLYGKIYHALQGVDLEIEDTNEILNNMEGKQVWAKMVTRDENSNMVAWTSLDDPPMGYQASPNNLSNFDFDDEDEEGLDEDIEGSC